MPPRTLPRPPTLEDFMPPRRGERTDTLARAIIARLMTAGDLHPSDDHALKALWGGDEAARIVVNLVTRGATTPATITTAGWASQLAQTAVSDFVAGLSPASAGAALLARGLQLSFDRSGSISVPALLPRATDVGFVAEGAAIPVVDYTISSAILAPRKLSVITAYSREMLAASNVENIIKATLTEAAALRLDAAMFDAGAGDAVRPAGLRNGVAALLAATSTVPGDALISDVKALSVAVAPVAGNTPIVLIAAPGQAAALRLRLEDTSNVFASSALAPGLVLAVASNALASAIDPAPFFESTQQATVHMDTVPLAIGTAGSPATVAAPTRSLYQTGCIGLKLRLGVAWATRTSGAVSWVENVLW